MEFIFWVLFLFFFVVVIRDYIRVQDILCIFHFIDFYSVTFRTPLYFHFYVFSIM
jgi:hypothetical protein